MIQSKFKRNKPILYDNLIITRVKQYLEENVHQTYVDVAVMAKQLQERYREYNRRKFAPFRQLVEQAYKTVLHSYGLDSNPSSDENDGGNSDLEMMEVNTNNPNHMNDMLTTMYSKNQNKNSNNQQGNNDNELIDISSDESGDENGKSNRKSYPSTKQFPGITFIKVKDKISAATGTESNKISDNGSKENASVSFGSQQTNKKRKIDEIDGNDIPKMPPLKSAGQGQGDGPITATAGAAASAGGGGGSMPALRIKRFKKIVHMKQPHYTFRDMGGMDKVLKELCELLFHIKHPEIYMEIGLTPPHGILLHGPSGCGKSMLAEAIAGQLNIGYIEVPATELIAGVSGESEERIREIFEQAESVAPCVLFIDEIDAISSNRQNAQKDMERRIVAQLISSLDNLNKYEHGDQVVVIGATNRPDVLDPALRRVGRFDHEIALHIPDRKEREEILIIVCEMLTLQQRFDYRKVAELTPGYVGADLLALATRAASVAVKRKYFSQLNKMRADKMGKPIPVVDLIDDNNVETDEKQKNEKSDEKKSEATNKESEKPIEANKPEENETDKIEKPSSTADSSTEEKQQPESSELSKSAVTSKENAENSQADEKDEEVQMMEVDGSKDEKNESVKPTQEEETIDVEEIEDDGRVENVEIQIKDPSLSELLAWLNLENQPVQDSQLSDLCVTLDDFMEAIKVVQPSAKREGFITVPDVTWDDIGSLRDIREELQLAVLAPVKYPEKMKALGLTSPSGILLCGPPGCGKTLLAKAVANEAGINFISVKGPELMNMYVGESERAVRQCFQRARNSAPCVIFFDEFDSLCPKRSDVAEGGSGARVVNQLLTEMDGVEDRKGVFLMAATNRPDIIDPAILRPGRLDTVLFIGLPDEKDRTEILEALTKHRTKPVLADDVNLEQISKLTVGFTGADLAGLIRQASLLALKESISEPDQKPEDLKVSVLHLLKSLKLIKPSVSSEDKKMYENLKLKYAAPRETSGTVSSS